MNFLVIANFKSNLTKEQVQSWLKTVKPVPGMVIAPSFPHLPLFTHLSPSLSLCAQDVSPFPVGSYTGAVNATQLRDYGVKYTIVGHSERRRYFHETPADIASKIKELLAVGITPLVCLERDQIAPQFALLDDDQIDNCLFCFEPSADIGGTTIAPLSLIKEVVAEIHAFAPRSNVIYGGSVTPDNVSQLLPLGLNGVLVATASLDPVSFLSIIRECSHVG